MYAVKLGDDKCRIDTRRFAALSVLAFMLAFSVRPVGLAGSGKGRAVWYPIGCLGGHFTVSADVDVPMSRAVWSAFE